jgi:hypothetical protein
MKSIKRNIFRGALPFLASALLLSSCFKKFDSDDYKPEFQIGGFSSVSEIAPTNLIAYWAFDGGLVDSISNTSGTSIETSFANGFKAQALQGKMNGYVLTDPSNAVKALTSFTLSYWINTPPPSTGIITPISISRTDGFWGNLEMFFENNSSNSDATIKTHLYNGTSDKEFAVSKIVNAFDKWVSITVTYDGASSTYKLYVNGAVVGTVTSAGFGNFKVTNPGKIVFGASQFMTTPSQTSSTGSQSWASFLTGQLDEVRLYNKVLAPEEVNALVVLQGKGK